MYGYSFPIVIYGFTEGETNDVIDEAWLNEHYPGIQIRAAEMIRGYLSEAIYGIVCEYDVNTGEPRISPADKNCVKAFFDKFMEYHGENRNATLGFYLGIVGDYGNCCTSYTFDEEH